MTNNVSFSSSIIDITGKGNQARNLQTNYVILIQEAERQREDFTIPLWKEGRKIKAEIQKEVDVTLLSKCSLITNG